MLNKDGQQHYSSVEVKKLYFNLIDTFSSLWLVRLPGQAVEDSEFNEVVFKIDGLAKTY